jgi:hypothetical protein
MARGDGGSFPVDVFRLEVGIAYEPLRCLWPLLGQDFSGALVREDAAQLLGILRPSLEIIDSPAEAGSVIDQLAALVPPAAALVAERFTSIGSLLTRLRLDAVKRSALLAATGQFEAAAMALSTFVPTPGGSPQQLVEQQHTIDQLKAWIETRDRSNLATFPIFRRPPVPWTPPLRWRIPVVMRAIWRWRRYPR